MSPNLTVPELLLVTACIQLLVYGGNTVLFGVSMFLLQRRKGERGNVYHTIMTVLLFVFITIEATLNTLQAVAAMRMTTKGQTINGVDASASNTVNLIVLQLVVMTSFAILANRCYHIWNRSLKIIALPTLMVFGETIIFYALVVPAYVHAPRHLVKGTDSPEYTEALDRQKTSDIVAALLSMLADTLLTILIGNIFLTLGISM
ncbi:hypothetical protein VNI00_007033 [Paramarasmius palmivorus]|uniref:Uncharacterized protein n=1 Tax=Paramarasmius palmivorus TaxID=297713 RepID=A0AAW0D5H3_9AGAR